MSASNLRIVNIATEQQIRDLVDAFYARVRKDDVLGPIFAKSIGHEWGPHLARMSDFWSTVILASRRYKGNPIAVHLALPGLTRDHFDRWLGYWRTTTSELLGEAAAAVFIQKPRPFRTGCSSASTKL
jgi:hemoglobin